MAIGLLLLGVLVQRASKLIFPAACLWLAGCALLPWLQYALGLGVYAGDALLSSFYVLGFSGAIFAGHACTRPKAEPFESGYVQAWMHMLWISAALSAAIGLLQWLSLTGPLHIFSLHTEPGERVIANLGQPNQLGTLLLMGIAALGYLFERRAIGRSGLLTGVGLLTVVLTLTESRTALLGATAIAAFLIIKGRTAKLRLTLGMVFSWWLIFLASVAALPVLNEVLLLTGGRVDSIFDSSSRWVLWKQIGHAIAEAPWFGYGWNQTPLAQVAGAIAHPGSEPISNAHNLALDLIVWTGLPLGVMLTGLCVYWLVNRLWRAQQSDAIYALACILPVAIHSMLEFPYAYAYFLLSIGFLIGIVEASICTDRLVKINSRWGWFALNLSSLIGGYLSYEYILIEEDYRIVRFENLRIGTTPLVYERPNIWMNSHLGALLKVTRLQATPAMTADQLKELRQVTLRFANRPLAFRYALALGLNNDPAGAKHQMQLIRGIYGENFYRFAQGQLRRSAETYPELTKALSP